jgi:hypothetical protein
VNERGRTGLVATLVGIVRRAVDLVLRIVDWIVSITIRRPPSRCAEVDGLPDGYHPNPVQCNTVNITAFDPGGGLMVYPGRSQPETLVKRQGGIKGFDAASRLENRVPPSSRVVVRAAHFGQSARIEAFSGASPAGMQMMAPTPGVEQGFTFTGSSIDRVVVTPAGDTLVIELCH